MTVSRPDGFTVVGASRARLGAPIRASLKRLPTFTRLAEFVGRQGTGLHLRRGPQPAPFSVLSRDRDAVQPCGLDMITEQLAGAERYLAAGGCQSE